MAIQFEFYESPDPTGENGKKYHARTVVLSTISTTQIAREIEEASSLTASDVKAVLSAVSNRIAKHLRESNSVHLEGIGYFQASLKVSREVIPGKTRSRSVWFKAVKYKADKELNRRLLDAPTVRSFIRNHSVNLTDEQVEKRTANYLKSHPYFTRKILQEVCGLTKSTALRHINRMIAAGKIKNTHTRKQPLYVWVEE